MPDGQKGLNQPSLNERIRCPFLKRYSSSFQAEKTSHTLFPDFFRSISPNRYPLLWDVRKTRPGVTEVLPYSLSWYSTLPSWLLHLLAVPQSPRLWEKTQTLAECPRLPSPCVYGQTCHSGSKETPEMVSPHLVARSIRGKEASDNRVLIPPWRIHSYKAALFIPPHYLSILSLFQA